MENTLHNIQPYLGPSASWIPCSCVTDTCLLGDLVRIHSCFGAQWHDMKWCWKQESLCRWVSCKKKWCVWMYSIGRSMKDLVSFSQKTLFHDTRRIQFFLAGLHISLEAVKTTTNTSLVSQCLFSPYFKWRFISYFISLCFQ